MCLHVFLYRDMEKELVYCMLVFFFFSHLISFKNNKFLLHLMPCRQSAFSLMTTYMVHTTKVCTKLYRLWEYMDFLFSFIQSICFSHLIYFVIVSFGQTLRTFLCDIGLVIENYRVWKFIVKNQNLQNKLKMCYLWKIKILKLIICKFVENFRK